MASSSTQDSNLIRIIFMVGPMRSLRLLEIKHSPHPANSGQGVKVSVLQGTSSHVKLMQLLLCTPASNMVMCNNSTEYSMSQLNVTTNPQVM